MNTNQPTTDRARLRNTLATAIRDSMARPKYREHFLLADRLMPTIRAAQDQAWFRGYVAGKLDQLVGRIDGTRRNPYAGGRHCKGGRHCMRGHQ